MTLTYNLKELVRIDKYLAGQDIPELYSRSLIDRLIEESRIKVNGSIVKKRYLLKENDIIDIELPKIAEKKALAEDIPLDIVYEDDYFAIINKAAGITVHPTPGNYSGTIVNAILNRFGSKLSQIDNAVRPGIVHRLDKNTSGLLMIAKDDKTLYQLNKLFAERMINKFYKAILIGIPANSTGSINTNIGRSRSDRTKMTVKTTGRNAITSYNVERTFEYFSLVDIRLETGRTHQIRVHFDHINCPVLGDTQYGNKKLKNLIPINLFKKVSYYIERQLKRQALHAYKLQFEHPVTGKELAVEVPLPEDIKNCLKWLESFLQPEDISSES